MVELIEAAAGVVEHAIQNHFHLALVGGLEQFLEGSIATQNRIHAQIILGVIPMVGRALEDGAQVERVHAQVLQVVQLLGHAQQVAALKAVVGGLVVPWLQVGRLVDALALGKAIREDLIEDGVFDPVGSLNRHG